VSDFKRCDWCKKEIQGLSLESKLSGAGIIRDRFFLALDFCNFRCLHLWAEEQDKRAKAES